MWWGRGWGGEATRESRPSGAVGGGGARVCVPRRAIRAVTTVEIVSCRVVYCTVPANSRLVLQHASLRARGRCRLSAAVLSTMEQLPVQPYQRLRPASPERVLRRCHTRL